MNSNDTKNMIMAIALSMAVIFTWQIFFAPPPPDPSIVEEIAETGQTSGETVTVQGAIPSEQPQLELSRDGALAKTGRVDIKTESVWGSISLKGGRLDDLHLSSYQETLDPGSDTVTLLNPTSGPHPYYATYGWLRTAEGETGSLPEPNTEWTVESGDVLAPGA
ncbi:MAG: membrane protein insertase YidC, partial [Pseudomonadota bacterium]